VPLPGKIAAELYQKLAASEAPNYSDSRRPLFTSCEHVRTSQTIWE